MFFEGSTLPEPSTATVISFIILVFSCVICLVLIVAHAHKDLPSEKTSAIVRTIIPCCVVMTITTIVAYKGVLRNWDMIPPPPMILMCVFSTINAVVCFCTKCAGRVATGLPLWMLLGFQVFRLPVELFLRQGYVEGFVPVQLTYQGRNFDIVTAVVALALSVVARYKEKAGDDALPILMLWLYNVLGLGMLINVVTTAMLSMPTKFRVFTNEPAAIFITFPPFIWLPAVLVQMALGFHLLLFRRLLAGDYDDFEDSLTAEDELTAEE